MNESSSRPLVTLVGGVLALMLGSAVPPVQAAEEPRPTSPALLLEILGRGPESRDAAYNDSLKQASPGPRTPFGVLQPDGSYKYGSVSVYVKESCPEAALYEPPPLPGRRRAH